MSLCTHSSKHIRWLNLPRRFLRHRNLTGRWILLRCMWWSLYACFVQQRRSLISYISRVLRVLHLCENWIKKYTLIPTRIREVRSRNSKKRTQNRWSCRTCLWIIVGKQIFRHIGFGGARSGEQLYLSTDAASHDFFVWSWDFIWLVGRSPLCKQHKPAALLEFDTQNNMRGRCKSRLSQTKKKKLKKTRRYLSSLRFSCSHIYVYLSN